MNIVEVDTAMNNSTEFPATSFAAGKLCDASLGVVAAKSKYADWWRYYLHPHNPPYSHKEPPTIEPTYYDWNYYISPVTGAIPIGVEHHVVNFIHP